MDANFRTLSLCSLLYINYTLIKLILKEGKISQLSVTCPPLFFYFIFFVFLPFSRAAPMASGGSQARGQIRAVATGLHQRHSNSGSELCLQPTPQLTATPDP